MSLLFETILIREAEPVNLKYHEYRFNQARKHFWKAEPLSLRDLISLSGINKNNLYRCRIDYDKKIEEITITPYSPKRISTLQTVISNDIDYSFKYKDRKILDNLFQRKGIADDILIIKNGLVTDTSIANIVFTSGEKYFTPASPLLNGTQRNFLIDSGVIEVTEIKFKDINKFKSWQHINALNPFDESRFNPVTSIYLL